MPRSVRISVPTYVGYLGGQGPPRRAATTSIPLIRSLAVSGGFCQFPTVSGGFWRFLSVSVGFRRFPTVSVSFCFSFFFHFSKMKNSKTGIPFFENRIFCQKFLAFFDFSNLGSVKFKFFHFTKNKNL